MSQAIIDFCQRLQTTLLGIEDQLAKARDSAERTGAGLAKETQGHLDTANRQLADFRAKAADMAAKLRQELPEHSGELKERLNQFGLEAQVALRHAAVFLAEATAKGASGASDLLHKGADRASVMAQHLRDDTAVAVRPGDSNSTSA